MPRNAPPTAPTLPDLDIHCPHCDYNLTGLPEPRCPECGNEFDLEFLIQQAADRYAVPVPWETADRPRIRAFIANLVFIVIHPHRFAVSFPYDHSPRRAATYSLCCYSSALLTFLCGCIAIAISNSFVPRPNGPPFAPMLLIIAAIPACWKCESLMAESLFIATPAMWRHFFSRRYWRSLMHYLSGFAVLAAPACILWLWLFAYDGRSLQTFRSSMAMTALSQVLCTASTITIAAAAIWWLMTVTIVVIAHFPPGRPRYSAYVAIPVVTTLTIALFGCFLFIVISLSFLLIRAGIVTP